MCFVNTKHTSNDTEIIDFPKRSGFQKQMSLFNSSFSRHHFSKNAIFKYILFMSQSNFWEMLFAVNVYSHGQAGRMVTEGTTGQNILTLNLVKTCQTDNYKNLEQPKH